MKKLLICLILLVSVWFCSAEPQVTHEQHKEQKIVVVHKPSSEKKIPDGWHVVCITADGGDIIYVLEKN